MLKIYILMLKEWKIRDKIDEDNKFVKLFENKENFILNLRIFQIIIIIKIITNEITKVENYF